MSSTRCHTFTGQGFDPFRPRAEDVRIEDAAHHQAMICRFGGATPVFYAVGQHSVSVARLVLEISGDPLWALHGLHHDTGEAYMGDIRRPLKSTTWVRGTMVEGSFVNLDVSFESWEMMVHDVAVQGLGIPKLGDQEDEAWQLIDAADDAMLRAEMLGLFGEHIGPVSMINAAPVKVTDCMDWRTAKAAFLAAHHDLMKQVEAAKC